jgi:hypothetical protein
MCLTLASTRRLVLDSDRSTIEVVMKKLAWIAALAFLGLGAMGTTGCARFGSYCTDAMDCVRGNDNDFDACEIQMKADAERADNWGCTEEFDELFDCMEAEAYCDGNDNWTTATGSGDRCESERRHHNECCGSFC